MSGARSTAAPAPLGSRPLTALALLGALGAGGPGLADTPPRVLGGATETRAAGAGFAAAFRELARASGAPVWTGYAVPAVASHDGACANGPFCCGSQRLEAEAGAERAEPLEPGVARLENGAEALVLFRLEQGAVDRVRTFSRSCALDASGTRVVWWAGVSPAQSLALLGSLAASVNEERAGRRLADAAVAAIARHAVPAADDRLEALAAPGRPDAVRRQAAFWMGVARGARGFAALRKLALEDPSDRFREHVAFALSRSGEPGAGDALIGLARQDRSSRVRGQALFWLAQKAGARAAGALTRAIEEDPETAVKKKAVFALSQLPKDEGVPLLIRTARENRNPEVRRQAIFWLGQTGDARALAFFEEVLSR